MLTPSGPAPPAPRLPPLRRILLWALLIRAAATVLWLALEIPGRTDTLFPEGAVVARALDFASGGTPYRDWRQWPHPFAPYGPLTYYPAGWVARGSEPADAVGLIYLFGRLQSFVSMLACAGLITLIVRRLGCGWRWGAGAAAAWLAWTPPLIFGATFRPDMPMTALALAALWIALGGPPAWPRTIGVLALLAAAFWFKPAPFGVLGAVFVWMWLGRGAARAAGVIAGFLALNLAAAALLNLTLDGALFLNMIGSLRNGTDGGALRIFLAWMGYETPGERFLMIFPWAVFLGGLAASAVAMPDLIRLLRSVGASDSAGLRVASGVLGLAALLTFALTSLQMLKLGSWPSYYLLSFAMCACAGAPFLKRLLSSDGPFGKIGSLAAERAVLAPIIAIGALASLIWVPAKLADAVERWKAPPAAERLRAIEGPVLVIRDTRLALERPAPPTIMDFAQFGLLWGRGLLSDAELIARVRNREFAAVVLWTPERMEKDFIGYLLTPELMPALQENYRPAERLEGVLILAPASGAQP